MPPFASWSALGFLLLMICLLIHILYDLFLLYCLKAEILSPSAFALEASAFAESQALSLLITLIGSMLFELENRKGKQNS